MAGIVSGLRVKHDKEMFFFSITDPTGSIECACFKDKFSLRENIQEGDFVVIEGRARFKEWDGDLRPQLTVRDIRSRNAQQPIRVFVNTEQEMHAYVASMAPFLSDKGNPVLIHVEETGLFMDPRIRVFPHDAVKGPCYKSETDTIGI